jgi:hypothetical protein
VALRRPSSATPSIRAKRSRTVVRKGVLVGLAATGVFALPQLDRFGAGGAAGAARSPSTTSEFARSITPRTTWATAAPSPLAVATTTARTLPVVTTQALPERSFTTRASPTGCDPNYAGACVPIASDVDCAGGGGNGPAYVRGPVRVVGRDIYGLDRDGDGIGCE